MAAKYPGQVNFVSENFGASKLAERFGVKGYPAVFVDDVLVASPREFGYFGEKDDTGRYAPWKNAANQAKFQADLIRMIDLILAGHKDVVSREHAGDSGSLRAVASLPHLTLRDVAGKPIAAEDLAGRPVLVEFWATWCIPCRSTLQWLGELKQKYGDRLAVVALAVESPEDQVRKMVGSLSQDLHWAIADDAAGQAFGDITSVPTLFLFDREGKTQKVLYGAPPGLHDEVAQVLDKLMQP